MKEIICQHCNSELELSEEQLASTRTVFKCPTCRSPIHLDNETPWLKEKQCKGRNCEVVITDDKEFCSQCNTVGTILAYFMIGCVSILLMVVVCDWDTGSKKTDEEIERWAEEYDQKKYNEKRDKEFIREWKYQNGIP